VDYEGPSFAEGLNKPPPYSGQPFVGDLPVLVLPDAEWARVAPPAAAAAA